MKSKSGRKLKELRTERGQSQEQLSLDTFLSRESISKFETGERRIQPELTNHYIKQHNDPMLALHAVSEYMGWHIDPLDGPAADTHRTSIHMKLQEEMQEAAEALEQCSITMNPDYVASYERENIKNTAMEVADSIHASVLYLAEICKSYGISWEDVWDEHQRKLQSRGYVKS
ncbi:helix-turn-helix transcriptional regulator [Salimicrobium jeotgali]|uniref:helix-turn-helix transcriptional regulator n=1 Tax=Salimicrobium jeotgali TaxID=1230341 RepID=UPI000C846E7B|nr:helix-turn-helix transcriptional regulator [Salimicrobium jeotgali]